MKVTRDDVALPPGEEVVDTQQRPEFARPKRTSMSANSAADAAPESNTNASVCYVDVDVHPSAIAFWGSTSRTPLLVAQEVLENLVLEASAWLGHTQNLDGLVQLRPRLIRPLPAAALRLHKDTSGAPL